MDNTVEFVCNGQYEHLDLLKKEKQIRKAVTYVNESSNHLDYMTLFIKLVKSRFCSYLSAKKGYEVKRINKSTSLFIKEMEVLAYELCKLTLCDVYTKRYLKSYLAASLTIVSFEILVDKAIARKLECIDKDMKLDLKHLTEIHKVLQGVFVEYFGYDKYVLFQHMGQFLFDRYRCMYYQHSGVLLQEK